MGLEGGEGAEGVLNGLSQLALGLTAATGGEVGPENRVIGVAAQVEGEVLLPQVDRGQIKVILYNTK